METICAVVCEKSRTRSEYNEVPTSVVGSTYHLDHSQVKEECVWQINTRIGLSNPIYNAEATELFKLGQRRRFSKETPAF